VDEFVAPYGHPDMRDRTAGGSEEDQITGFERISRNPASEPELIIDGARHRDPVLGEHVPDQAAAVEP
jgi:hypothetical protein